MNAVKEDSSNQNERELLHEISTGGNFSLFVIYCLFIIYIAITVNSTTDIHLLMPASEVLLPILEAKILLTRFYCFISLLVLIFHFYLLHRREGYEKKIKQCKKPCPVNFFGIAPEKRVRGALLIFFANAAFFFLGPVCLFYIQWRFSDYQSLGISSVHFVCLSVVAVALLRNEEFEFSVVDYPTKMTSLFRTKNFPSLKQLTLILILLCGTFNYFIVGMLYFEKTRNILLETKVSTLWLFPKITFPSSLKNVDLSERRLMFADLKNTDLKKITLKGAYLQGADMKGAQLQGIDMGPVQLHGADVRLTQLLGVDMRRAHLQGADMMLAQLQGADMRGVQLQGADMSGARLQGADMRSAQLQNTTMRFVHLQGADMLSAQLQGADMKDAQLQGANMVGAQLQGVYIKGAQFHGANTKNTVFNGSFCEPEIRGFFDRVNGRIGKLGLDGCNPAAFGVLWEDATDEIIEDLRKNKPIPARIIRQVQKRMAGRVGESATVKERRKGELTSGNACAIIKNWEESVKSVPKFDDAVTNWLNTASDINPDLRKCLASK